MAISNDSIEQWQYQMILLDNSNIKAFEASES